MNESQNVPHPIQLDRMAHRSFQSLVNSVVTAHSGLLVDDPQRCVEILLEIPPDSSFGPAAAFLITAVHGNQRYVMGMLAEIIQHGLLGTSSSENEQVWLRLRDKS